MGLREGSRLGFARLADELDGYTVINSTLHFGVDRLPKGHGEEPITVSATAVGGRHAR